LDAKCFLGSNANIEINLPGAESSVIFTRCYISKIPPAITSSSELEVVSDTLVTALNGKTEQIVTIRIISISSYQLLCPIRYLVIVPRTIDELKINKLPNMSEIKLLSVDQSILQNDPMRYFDPQVCIL
jgi:hypothetical protein